MNPASAKTVLIVEDNELNMEIAEFMLKSAGAEVVKAFDGESAVRAFAADPAGCDAILMDLMMPVMDGYEASRRIRNNGRWLQLPIIALTANALPDDRERCRAAGMNDYLAKPFRREELAVVLDTWLPDEVNR